MAVRGWIAASLVIAGMCTGMKAARANDGEAPKPNPSLSGDAGGVLVKGRELCGPVLIHSDDVYESAFGWQYGGVQAPTYGAFAECYTGTGQICAAVFDLTRVSGDLPPATMDAYVWEDGGGIPGSVLCVATGHEPAPIAFWPQTSREEVPFPDCCVSGQWWIGYWPNWPGEIARWYVAVDDTNERGCTQTSYAPGIGYPTGWHDVTQAFGSAQSLGIGAELVSCSPTPVRGETWSRVKAIYRERD